MQKTLALNRDLGNDDMTSDVVDPPSHDLLVERSPSGEGDIFPGGSGKSTELLSTAENRRKTGFSTSSLGVNSSLKGQTSWI